jgi:hypothetical protein
VDSFLLIHFLFTNGRTCFTMALKAVPGVTSRESCVMYSSEWFRQGTKCLLASGAEQKSRSAEMGQAVAIASRRAHLNALVLSASLAGGSSDTTQLRESALSTPPTPRLHRRRWWTFFNKWAMCSCSWSSGPGQHPSLYGRRAARLSARCRSVLGSVAPGERARVEAGGRGTPWESLVAV